MTMALPDQLPLMVSLAGIATDDPTLTPGNYSLPADAVTLTEETTREEDLLLTGYGVALTPATLVRAVTLRVEAPAGYPIPRALGEKWARLRPGVILAARETHSDRSYMTHYTNAEVISNTLRVSRQLSLQRAYYSGSIELRVLVEWGA